MKKSPYKEAVCEVIPLPDARILLTISNPDGDPDEGNWGSMF